MKTLLKGLVGIMAVVLALATISVAADAGADMFKAKCAMCHGPSGTGDTAMGKNLKLRDLGSAEVQGQADADLATIIGKGKGKMPAYEAKGVSKDQIDSLVKFIRTLKK